MAKPILFEEFSEKSLDERLVWYSTPDHWSIQNSALVVKPQAHTDYWRNTHYGFSVDNGPFLFLEVEGDFVLTTRVRFFPANQYDQAGLMVRLSADHWIKTCVEHEPNPPSWLGVVVTNFGYSDWSTQPYQAQSNEIELRIQRTGDDYLVQYSDPLLSSGWSQLRITHLFNPDHAPIKTGLFACSPKGSGFRAEFQYLRIE
jgi:uncharacterized protein